VRCHEGNHGSVTASVSKYNKAQKKGQCTILYSCLRFCRYKRLMTGRADQARKWLFQVFPYM